MPKGVIKMDEKRIREIVREEMKEAIARTIASLGIKLIDVEESEHDPDDKTIKGIPVIAGYAAIRDKAQQTHNQDSPIP